jgi:hypothetical protein
VATAVLGTRLTLLGWARAGIVMLLIAFVLWAALLRPVLAGWKSPSVGVSLLFAVAPESLTVLAATLATPEHARWLLIAALVLAALGLGLYLFIISRFDFHQIAVDRGDHWITGGALGICTLAAARIALAAKALGVLGGLGAPLEDIAIGLWVLTMLWLLVLLFAEALVAAALDRARAVVDRVPARDVRRLQLRRRGPRPRGRDHELRASMGMGRARIMGDRLYGHDRACGVEGDVRPSISAAWLGVVIGRSKALATAAKRVTSWTLESAGSPRRSRSVSSKPVRALAPRASPILVRSQVERPDRHHLPHRGFGHLRHQRHQLLRGGRHASANRSRGVVGRRWVRLSTIRLRVKSNRSCPAPAVNSAA